MACASRRVWPRLLFLGISLLVDGIAAVGVKIGQDRRHGLAALVLSKDSDLDEDNEDRQEKRFYCRAAERIGSEAKWRARGHQVIFMIGDSTMRAQFKFLCDLSNASIMPSGDIRKMEVSWCEVGMPGGIKVQPVFFGRNEASYCDVDLVARMEEVIGRRPDVIYFGGGLHWLHIIPKLQWERPDCWWDLERNMARFLAVASARARDVVNMEIHSVCEEKMSGRSLEISKVYRRDPSEAAEDCARAMAARPPIGAAAAAAFPAGTSVLDVCRGSFLFRDGAERLHIRAQKAIKAWEEEQHQVLRQVNAWNITDHQCKATTDGLHIPSLVHVEVVSLWEALGWAEEAPVDYLRAMGCNSL